MIAHIISIGDELLIGDTINTNASWLGQYLSDLGFLVAEVKTIGDNAHRIKRAVKHSLKEADLTIVTGGLGPTHDDITKHSITELFGGKLILNSEVLDFVKSVFLKRGIPFSKSNMDQAMVPDCATVIFNEKGTAPGLWFSAGKKHVAVLPGVPAEMKHLMKSGAGALIADSFREIGVLETRYIKTAGIGESTLSDIYLDGISDILNSQLSLAFLPYHGGVSLRLSSTADSKEEAIRQLNILSGFILERAGEVVFGTEKESTLPEALGLVLKKQNATIAVAESCSGGLICDQLTDVPGCSEYFLGGIIAYSNQAKIKKLGVPPQLIDNFGAVSKEVAIAMAKGVANKLGASVGISTTGIAGPGGGSEEKPVGTVWMGFYSGQDSFAVKARFTKDRIINKQRTAVTVLEIARRTLLGISKMPYDLPVHSD